MTAVQKQNKKNSLELYVGMEMVGMFKNKN